MGYSRSQNQDSVGADKKTPSSISHPPRYQIYLYITQYMCIYCTYISVLDVRQPAKGCTHTFSRIGLAMASMSYPQRQCWVGIG